MTTAVRLQNIHKRFGALEVLRGITLEAQEGEVLSLLGSSGSGKSTLLRCINMLEIPNDGRVKAGQSTPRRSTGSDPALEWSSKASTCGRT